MNMDVSAFGVPLDRHDEIKFWFPCSETSGDTITDTVRNIVHRPADVGDGSLGFTVSHAVTITNNSSALATPLHSGTWPLLNLRKVLINAAVIKTVTGNKAKIPIGSDTIDLDKFTISFDTAMHLSLHDGADNYIIYSPDAVHTLSDNTDYIIYAMWNGLTSELSGAALTHAGQVATSSTSPFPNMTLSTIDTSVFSDIPTIQPSAGTRVTSIHCYGWGLWEFDAVPSNLNSKLASLATRCVAGNKTPYLS